MDFATIQSELATKGFVVVPDVLTPEQVAIAKDLHAAWRSTIPNHAKIHAAIDPHGIYKFHQVGHQRFAWYIRTQPAVQAIFKQLWNTDRLIVSFDGSCYIDHTVTKKDTIWTHTDQAPANTGLRCYQGFVALTTNIERTLVVYEGSHKYHEAYFKHQGNTSTKNWCKIDHETLHKMAPLKRVLAVPAGALVLWDSRTFHQNQYGAPGSEERIVQYVCYLPADHPKNTEAMRKKRAKYFAERRTTSHWPAPITVNGLQPQTYGDTSMRIDYDTLTPPDLSGLEDKIASLL